MKVHNPSIHIPQQECTDDSCAAEHYEIQILEQQGNVTLLCPQRHQEVTIIYSYNTPLNPTCHKECRFVFHQFCSWCKEPMVIIDGEWPRKL